MDTSQIISVAIFVVAMIAIMTEKVHRALVAITGAMLLLILHIMPFETAIGHIDDTHVRIDRGKRVVGGKAGLFGKRSE